MSLKGTIIAMMQLLRSCCILSISLIFLSMPMASAESQLSNLAEDMVQLRSEVEKLHDEIQSNKDIYESRLQSLNIQKADLSANLQRHELQVKQLTEQLGSYQKQISELTEASAGSMEEVLGQQIAAYQAYILASLPFKHADRLKQLQDIKTSLENKTESPYKLAGRLWALTEDELRLHRDVGIYKELITVDGQDHLAEIVRLGMLSFFYMTPEGKVGQMRKENGEWQLHALTARNEKKSVENLFAAQKKQLRFGAFELPRFF